MLPWVNIAKTNLAEEYDGFEGVSSEEMMGLRACSAVREESYLGNTHKQRWKRYFTVLEHVGESCRVIRGRSCYWGSITR
jgi:hypothetical protein